MYIIVYYLWCFIYDAFCSIFKMIKTESEVCRNEMKNSRVSHQPASSGTQPVPQESYWASMCLDLKHT